VPSNSDIRTILLQHISGEISGEDRIRFYDMVLDEGREEEFKMVLKELGEEYRTTGRMVGVGDKGGYEYKAEDWDDMVRSILNGEAIERAQALENAAGLSAYTEKAKVFRIPFYKKIGFRVAAAALICSIGLSVYFLVRTREKQNEIAKTKVDAIKNDVAPGTNKAVLTLANGSTIILDSARNGLLVKQSGSSVIKTDSGKLVYNASGEKHVATVVLNTLSTPRGGQFQLVLPDGTKVWLNAASSITYPTSFSGKERKVAITGEAYFEVVHNEKMPFRVQVGDQVVEDIGTAFNINAYPDESSVKTTLLQGTVKVTASKNEQSLIIKPGEQTDLTADQLSLIKNVNTNEIIAWKEGSFDFESADLKTILRQFARWYDVDVEYQGAVSNRKFFAIVARNTSLKKVLELLQDNNIKYVIEGKKLTIISN
jgi:transmembrane sensor